MSMGEPTTRRDFLLPGVGLVTAGPSFGDPFLIHRDPVKQTAEFVTKITILLLRFLPY